MPSSGRRPHLWRIRNKGYRELLLSKKWTMCGGYAVKTIRGRQVMVMTVEEHDDYILSAFQLKGDFWARITTDAREREARERRGKSKLV